VSETNGVLLLDKPVGPTSREVLDGVQRRIRVVSLGHAGTLDPLASGLLVVLAGRARRLQEYFLARGKAYVARVRFGQTSPTLDAEGPVAPSGAAPDAMSEEDARALLARFEGAVLQVPPAFSALRVKGRRSHKLARKGRAVVLEARPVRIDRVSLLAIEEPDWIVEVTCGPGVYLRSLARDLGEARGCGAYLAGLRRTRSGPLRVEDAVAPSVAARELLLPLATVLAEDSRLDVSEAEAIRLRLGDVISRPETAATPPVFAWFGGRPCFKLVARAPGLLRSDFLLEEPIRPKS
jgi:tRNA pseudouridine55 synthase